MGLLGSARGVGEIWKIIRELDLVELQQAADRPIRLLVTGDGPPAGVLAETLSASPGSSGVHPWISVLALPLGPDEPEFRPDVALVVTDAADHGHEAQAAIRQLVR